MSQGTSYQVISEPEQVRQVLRRVDDFLPTNALTSVVPLSPAALRILSRSRFALPPVLASATGELHRTVRSVVAGFFTPAKVAAIGPRVRELTRKHAQAAAAELAHGPVDLAQSVARPHPAGDHAGTNRLPAAGPGSAQALEPGFTGTFLGLAGSAAPAGTRRNRRRVLHLAEGRGHRQPRARQPLRRTARGRAPDSPRSARWATSCSSPGRKPPRC